MQTLAQDVGGLKRVLSNVKTRGNIGEIQLSMLLELFVYIFREFSVYGKVYEFSGIIPPGELDCEFNDRIRTFPGMYIRRLGRTPTEISG